MPGDVLVAGVPGSVVLVPAPLLLPGYRPEGGRQDLDQGQDGSHRHLGGSHEVEHPHHLVSDVQPDEAELDPVVLVEFEQGELVDALLVDLEHGVKLLEDVLVVLVVFELDGLEKGGEVAGVVVQLLIGAEVEVVQDGGLDLRLRD